jgi:hypothetical protein
VAVGSIEFSKARLVPTLGGEGWLCRLPDAIVWTPASGQGTAAFVAACLAASDPTDLLGRIGARLADPRAEPWPPFAVLAQRADDLVAVVHGPVEVAVERADGAATKLYGGDDVGSWLNRLLHEASTLRAGRQGEADPLSDLREGVIRASGFVLAARGGTGRGSAGVAPAAKRAEVPEPGTESPTVAEPIVASAADFTVAEVSASAFREPRGAGQAATAVMSAIGKLTWDNGEVHELPGPVLIGRDVASDEAVLSGELSPIVPSGQNDSMSRVHAELRLRGGEVVVVDRGSTNGTFIWDEPAKAWQRLNASEPHVVRSGAVLAFGERTATFDSLTHP